MKRQSRSLVLTATVLLLLTSCASAPYIMEGVAIGLAETSYQLEMEQRRQWQIQAEQNRIDHEFRQAMYRYQLRENRRQYSNPHRRGDHRQRRHSRRNRR